MVKKKQCIALLLAGGQGTRLKDLTKKVAKPAVSFGGKYRIIDFSLSNCANSNINTVGVLTQYRPMHLNNYLGTGDAWNLDVMDGGISMLPPYETQTGASWYTGTASAVYQNIDFIRLNDPKYVLILSGDHLYSMDYQKMIASHEKHNADLTVSVMRVPWEETSRFGIL
ncbi:MAG: NTP transferase domain-containing protein, partial [Eggerthellaceae bacterium]|nr:NTP transferase domain-containing protein [Eggerthellaceae bacterium]